MNENENITCQNLGISGKALFDGRYIVLNVYIRKLKKGLKVNDLSFDLKKLEKKKSKLNPN